MHYKLGVFELYIRCYSQSVSCSINHST